MRTAAGHIFTAAVLGTLVLPLVLALLGLRAPHGRRTRLVLVAAAAWLGLCVIAGVGRFFADDGYYAPSSVSVWAESSAGERELAVALVVLVAVAAATAAAAARRSVPAASGVALVALVWLVDLVMLADLATLSLGH
ncbi:MAG TPA: hypothetical protein VFX13_13000 [Gaiellales bacterium]|jgi:hypothetical protein|nr:hypothetical protein [Gaiellales bacterium]